MTKKNQKETKWYSDEKYPRKFVPCETGSSDSEIVRRYAELFTSSSLAAYRILDAAEKESVLADKLDVPALMDTLREQATAVNRNDLSHVEGMLMNQATALQSLFARLAEKALCTEYVSTFDTMMKMALRAQSQCRATLETLAAIKNPPVVIAKQANVTSGPQQINNSMEAPPPARKNETEQTKLSGAENELLQNTGASRIESGTYQEMETVGEVHRAKDSRRKSEGIA